MSVLDHDSVRGELLRAWDESDPGTEAAHEEGGFILMDTTSNLIVERWPRGAQNEITVPDHTFHTHPNIGPEFQQTPSRTDVRAVRFDPNLEHPEYEGEYVISHELVYLIRKNGEIEEVGNTLQLLVQ